MAYSDYSFYITTFYGDLIPDAEYTKWSNMAKDKLDYVTFNNIPSDYALDEGLTVKIKKSECAIAEILYKLNKADSLSGTSTEGKGKILKSESAGAVSQSYEVGKTLVEKAVVNITDIDKVAYDTIRPYLSGTGLLYAGL